MSPIIPFQAPAVTPRTAQRVERVLTVLSGRPRFSAIELAEVEARYAGLLAARPTPLEGCALTEPTGAAVGTPLCDRVEFEARLAMWAEPGVSRSFSVRLDVAGEPVELDPRQARDAAASLRRIAAALTDLAADAEALTVIEAGR